MGKGGGGSQTSTTTNTPWSEAQPYLKEIMGDAQGLYQDGPINPFPGLTVAQRSFPTMLAEELTLGRALAGSGITDSARNQYQKTVDGAYTDPTTNPAFQAGMDRVTDQYNETVAPQTDTAFARSGAFGGSAHQNQMGINQRELSRGLSDTAANIYNQERGYQNQAMQLAPSFAQNDYKDIAAISTVGDQRDGYNQALLNDAVDKYGFEQNAEWDNLNRYLSAIGGSAAGTNTKSETKPNGGNSLASGLGDIANTATAVASLGKVFGFSDIRLKDNIKPLGKENGHNVYEFTYKEQPDRKYIGVMAQEIAETNPDAVGERGGFMTVDYSKLGVNFREVS